VHLLAQERLLLNSEVVDELAQVALYESLLASEHRTTNGEEADFFFVPLLHACIVGQADDAPHLSMQVPSGIKLLFRTCTDERLLYCQ
jgi:hypothetical protein